MKKTYNYSESKILKRIGNTIREGRIKKNISMFELGRRSGIHQGTIKKIEAGITNPSIMVLEALTSKLKINVSV